MLYSYPGRQRRLSIGELIRGLSGVFLFLKSEARHLFIDETLIAYLEDLSRLTLSDLEKQRISGDLEKILQNMGRLGTLDTTGIPERSHPFDNVNAFRDDTPQNSLARELILQNAPETSGEMFIAPKTID
jgi:aspartyl-tRNA(Asn)/glutamyl-tRNA(Gln) amidotransferase subunit C